MCTLNEIKAAHAETQKDLDEYLEFFGPDEVQEIQEVHKHRGELIEKLDEANRDLRLVLKLCRK